MKAVQLLSRTHLKKLDIDTRLLQACLDLLRQLVDMPVPARHMTHLHMLRPLGMHARTEDRYNSSPAVVAKAATEHMQRFLCAREGYSQAVVDHIYGRGHLVALFWSGCGRPFPARLGLCSGLACKTANFVENKARQEQRPGAGVK